ncbi:MAG: HAD family phosphatase [Ruminococcaceae bacterium]|nr:HAD family phosphatase [Oscillospiraceae bacterium]
MKRFEGILFISDLDGTLMNSEHKLSAENSMAIEYFKENGGLFTFVTGRMPCTSASICEAVRPNAPFGCINGGGIFDHIKNEYLWTLPLSHDVIELVEFADNSINDLGIQVNTFENIYFCKENTQMEIFRRITGLPNLTADYKKINEPIAKILFGDSDPEVITHLAKILTEHPKAYMYDFIRSEPNLYEILPKGSGKGNLIPKLAEIVGVSMDNTIAVGDYYNDISMLKAARIGIAVANACDEAKEAADFVTVSNDEHAIAQIISDIDSGRIYFDK